MKSNKTFVKSMIITSIIGFIGLLIILFIGIKYFVNETIPRLPESTETKEEVDETFYITSVGLVRELNESSITYLDIDKKEIITHKIKPTTKIQDTHENIVSYEMIQPGSIVEIVYQPQKDNLVCVRLSKEAFTKSNMKNLEINRSNRTITIGSRVYYYTGHTDVMDSEGNMINIYEVSDYDILQLKGIGDHIYSIQIMAKQGYLQLEGLPIYEGILEIDRNRQIPLVEDMPATPITPGEHKVVIHLKGYEPIVTTLTIEPGKTLEYNLQDPVRQQSHLIVQVMNTDVNYQVKVGDEVYTKEEAIQVPTGSYTIEVTADGFKPYKQSVTLEQGTVLLQVALVPLENEENSTDTVVENENTGDNTESNNTEDSAESDDTAYKINISSDPVEASIYIDGEYKGVTPFKSTLEVGEHTIVLKKEGYKDYETNILIDHSDDQNNYLYTLIPN